MTSHPSRSIAKSAKAFTSLAAVCLVFALGACTSNPGAQPGEPAQTPQAPVPVPGPGSTPGNTIPKNTPVAEEMGYLDAAAMMAAVQKWADATPGTQVNDQQALRSQLPKAEKWLEGITVVPEKCGLYGIGNIREQLDQAAMAAAVLPPAGGGDLMVASYQDRGALVADVAAQQHLDESCGKYTVTADGQTILSTVSRLDVTTSAPYSSASMLESVNGTKETRSVSVRAIDGHTMMTATRVVAGEPEEATTQALADIESMLGILRSTQPGRTPAP
ncbi:hypothetical protein [Paeniglutamicibacter antarcticus]|uniref:PknH-like protein n=1 Tax=Paeniglutamicibacter antarcticus TaxID=494023 RepID=A0ABP9TM25_9MICC